MMIEVIACCPRACVKVKAERAGREASVCWIRSAWPVDLVLYMKVYTKDLGILSRSVSDCKDKCKYIK